jgi:O-antigen/teichoic acid export membrane protein
VTKALLAKFGGLAMTGFYDMASRWVFTFRELIVQANLVLVPTVSSLRERDSAAIPRIYLESYRVIFFLAVPAFTFLAVVSPIVSHIWLGRYEPAFVRFVALLAAGWLVNVLSNPAYVVDLGTGALRWVSIGCAATAVLNPLLGYLAGRYSGATAIVAVAALSLSLGYLIILVAYHVENRVSFLQLIPSHSAGLVCASALGVIGFLPYFCSDFGHAMSSAKTISVMALAVLTMILPIWRHPLRKRLMGWVASSLPA